MSLAHRTPPTPAEYEAYKNRFRNWGRWGADDALGTLNFVTTEKRAAAATLARSGQTVSLSRPLATERVVSGPRNSQPVQHTVTTMGMGCADFIGIAYHGFVNTHIDGLCHIFTEDGRMYGGRPASDVQPHGATSNAVDAWSAGIVTRGVLYDVVRHRGTPHVGFDTPVHGWELADIAAANGITPEAGDAVIVRAGADAFWRANPDFAAPWEAPGLHASVLEFLWETHAALLGWDLMEAPGQSDYNAPGLPIHTVAIPYMGLPLLDNCDLEGLAEACATLDRFEFMLLIAPLMVLGGTGSPVNPIALF